MGGRLDDVGASAALPTVGNFRPRPCAGRRVPAGALVPALALWTVARRETGSRLAPPLPPSLPRPGPPLGHGPKVTGPKVMGPKSWAQSHGPKVTKPMR